MLRQSGLIEVRTASNTIKQTSKNQVDDGSENQVAHRKRVVEQNDGDYTDPSRQPATAL